MSTVIKATDYGYRKVIQVCSNPDDPEAVHVDGRPHTGEPSEGTDPALKSWEWCSDCQYNWDVREFVWTGEELYITPEGEERRAKTDDELVAEIKDQLAKETPKAAAIPTLEGVTI